MSNERIPAFVDMYPEEEGTRRVAFEPGGVGDFFVHASNRNQCSYLMESLPSGYGAMERFERAFPIGYSILVLLQKVCVVGREHESRIPAALRQADNYAVLIDPRKSAIGGSALVSKESSYRVAKDVAHRLSIRTKCSTVVAIIVERIPWH